MDSPLKKKIVKHIVDGLKEHRPMGKPVEEIADAILKSVADEGYLQSLKHNGKTLVVNGKDPLGYVVYYPDEIMTGQEWANELNKLDPPVYVHNDGKTYYMFEQEKLDNFLAAKKAAGMK